MAPDVVAAINEPEVLNDGTGDDAGTTGGSEGAGGGTVGVTGGIDADCGGTSGVTGGGVRGELTGTEVFPNGLAMPALPAG